MKILANENIPLLSVKVLEKAGYDIKYIGTECPSITDEEIMQIAISEDRTIITFDRDYGELIYKYGYKPQGGVIYLRIRDFEPSELGEYLVRLFETKKYIFKRLFTVIDRISIRQRKY